MDARWRCTRCLAATSLVVLPVVLQLDAWALGDCSGYHAVTSVSKTTGGSLGCGELWAPGVGPKDGAADGVVDTFSPEQRSGGSGLKEVRAERHQRDIFAKCYSANAQHTLRCPAGDAGGAPGADFAAAGARGQQRGIPPGPSAGRSVPTGAVRYVTPGVHTLRRAASHSATRPRTRPGGSPRPCPKHTHTQTRAAKFAAGPARWPPPLPRADRRPSPTPTAAPTGASRKVARGDKAANSFARRGSPSPCPRRRWAWRQRGAVLKLGRTMGRGPVAVQRRGGCTGC